MQLATDNHFSRSFLLLQQEAFLVHTCLATGLTAIRSADPGTKGLYYSAFFHLSIGVERLLKVILIIDHMAANRLTAPSREQLRSFGHDLVALHTQIVGARSVAGALSQPKPGSIEEAILAFLRDYARTTRYHNLDALSSSTALLDPLAAYSRIFTRVLSEDVDRRVLQRIRANAEQLAALTDSEMGVVGHDLEGRLITQEGVFQLGPLHDVGARHMIVHLYALLQPLRTALELSADAAQKVNHEVSPRVAAIPYMGDFLIFLTLGRAAVLKKKRWP